MNRQNLFYVFSRIQRTNEGLSDERGMRGEKGEGIKKYKLAVTK